MELEELRNKRPQTAEDKKRIAELEELQRRRDEERLKELYRKIEMG